MKNTFQTQTPYENWISIKPALENNKSLLAIVKDSIQEQRRFEDVPNYIGAGESNILLRIGELRVNDNMYHLAFRTNHCIFYDSETYGSNDFAIISDIARFDQIAEKIEREKSNYIQSQKFFGLVKWWDRYDDRFGIILEDLTQGGKYKVFPQDYETASVFDNKKEFGRYFIDPLLSPDNEERAKKYLDSAIDLGDFLKKS